jgi:hypothetical protein
MPTNSAVPRLCLGRFAACLLLMLASCSQLPPTSSVAIPPIPAGDGRIWFYRNDGPYDSQERPYLRLNGQVAALAEPNGAFFRDVPPGHYVVTVDSYGLPYPYQFAQLDLAAGQEAFVKVASMRERVGGGDNIALRAIFYTWLIPPDAARAAIAGTPFYGSG